MTTEKIGTVSLAASLIGAWFVLKVIVPKCEAKIDYMHVSSMEPDEAFDHLSTRTK